MPRLLRPRSDRSGVRASIRHICRPTPRRRKRPRRAIVEESPALAPLAATTVEQVRLQASQLAAHLQRQASTVDHREGELNARLAAMEDQVRAARLWLTEQNQELEARKAELDRREQDLIAHSGQPSAVPPGHLKRRASAPGDEALAEREAELERRQAELDALASRMAGQVAAAGEVEALRQQLRSSVDRVAALDRAEKLLASQQAELERGRNQLAVERAQFQEQSRHDRLRFVQEQQSGAESNDKTRRELARLSDELAARQDALEQMRADMSHSQQDVLEIRLATEELWARLCGTMAPAALTQSIAQVRLQLADQHRLVRAEMAQQKQEIQALTAQLTEQHQKLARRREDVQAWVEARQRELEQQAATLAQAERRIAEERDEQKRARVAWDSERFQLTQEIRRLLCEQARAATTV